LRQAPFWRFQDASSDDKNVSRQLSRALQLPPPGVRAAWQRRHPAHTLAPQIG